MSWFSGMSVSMAICMHIELTFKRKLCNSSSNNMKLYICHSTNRTDRQNSRILTADNNEMLYLPDYKCNLQKYMVLTV
jgi:hypothetical protein